MMPADIPPAIRERVVCSISAAAKYGVPANIILAVAEREGGRPGQWVRNTNATYDIGTMQFNTAYLATLARYRIRTGDVARAGCFSFDLAAWRLRGHIRNDAGDLWTRVANYHSHTPRHNAPYRAAIMVMASRWGTWLTARYHTYETLTVAERPLEPRKALAASDGPLRASSRPLRESKTLVVYQAARYVPRSIGPSPEQP